MSEFFHVTKRCFRCRKPLRSDGTCQNPKCVRYKPPKATATTSDDTSKQ